MRKLHDSLRLLIAEQILKTEMGLGAQAAGLSLGSIVDMLVEPPNPALGDLAFGCFPLAKQLKQGPPQIAQQLKTQLAQNSDNEKFFIKIEAAGPYLNFTFRPEVVGEKLLSEILKGDFFKRKLLESNGPMMVEYSQPNTHKELHVGHMRNACLGSAVVKTLRYAGQEVISATFPGDVGTHVAKCLWYLKYHNQEAPPAVGRGEWLGSMYSRANLKLEDEAATPKAEENKKLLTEILHQLEEKKGEYFDLWKETREWSVQLMKDTYQWAEIDFDRWYWESEVDSPSVKYVKELLSQGKLVTSQGAVGMNLEDENLGFCMLIKSDGTGLYATKDIELARRKFQDFNIKKSIYVVDMRQALHFKQVFKVLERLGFEQAKDCFHLQYNFVELPDGAMSSRKGNIVPLMRLVQNMEAMVKEKYLARYRAGAVAESGAETVVWPEAEINLVARQVAQGAIKYGMVKIDNNKKIVFDMDEWLQLDGDSGPFIQYSCARINSLCKKFNFDSSQFNSGSTAHWSLLNHAAERNLYQALMNFHSVVVQASETYRPSIICTYLYDVAKRFNFFYHECSIGQAETKELQQARLALSYSTREVLKQGLGLIGIPAPDRM